MKGVFIMADEIYKNQNITLENRRKLTVSGVTDVESFDDNSITLITTSGTLMIKGVDIKIEKLSLDTNEVIANGDFFLMEYISDETTKRSFFARMFK